MTNQHPITPPPELLSRWEEDWHHAKVKDIDLEDHIATQAAQWGADQELEACCEWLTNEGLDRFPMRGMREARRPKPPSLKEQALEAQQRMWNGESTHGDWQLIRRALEQLND